MKYKELKEAKVYKTDVTSNSGMSHFSGLIYENPTPEQLLNAAKIITYPSFDGTNRIIKQVQSWRGLILWDDRLLVWDANEGTHNPIQRWAWREGLGDAKIQLYFTRRLDNSNEIRASSMILASGYSRNNKYVIRMLKGFDVTWS